MFILIPSDLLNRLKLNGVIMCVLQKKLLCYDSFHDFFPEYISAEKFRQPDLSNGTILWQQTVLADLLPKSLLTAERMYVPRLAPFFEELDQFETLDTPEFQRFWEESRRYFHALLEEHIEELSRPHTGYHPGDSVGYDKPVPPVLPENWGRLHFRNALSPESFLDHEEYFADNLLRVLDEAEKAYHYTVVTSFTWLNSLPKFLRFFPEIWQKNVSDIHAERVYNNFGFLGQLVNSSGMLNRKTADYLVRTGKLLYTPKRCRCTFDELREHLQQFIN